MNTTIRTSRTAAILAANEILRRELGVSRLGWTNVEASSTSCNCGETAAVCVTTEKKDGGYIDVKVGICKYCKNHR